MNPMIISIFKFSIYCLFIFSGISIVLLKFWEKTHYEETYLTHGDLVLKKNGKTKRLVTVSWVLSVVTIGLLIISYQYTFSHHREKLELVLKNLHHIEKIVFYKNTRYEKYNQEISDRNFLDYFEIKVCEADSHLDNNHNSVIFESTMKIVLEKKTYELYVTINKNSKQDLYIGILNYGTIFRIPDIGKEIFRLIPEGRLEKNAQLK